MDINKVILSLVFLLLCCVGAADKPSFRIVAPQFICTSVAGQSKENTSIAGKTNSPPELTVQMQTRGGQLLKYTISVFFEILGGYRNQRHTLLIWRSVRLLEKKFKNDTDLISLKNQIDILNKDLTKGVRYIFTIVGFDDIGVRSDEQNFTITYKDAGGSVGFEETAAGSSVDSDVSLVLLGSVVTYVDNPYTVEAKLSFCTPIIDYFFKWRMTPLTEGNNEFLKIPGSILFIPLGVLEFGKLYEIEVKVFPTTDESKQITGASMKLNLMRKKLSVELYPIYTELGLNRNASFRIKYYTTEKPQLEWTCKDASTKEECLNFQNSANEEKLIPTPAEGQFEIEVEATLDDEKVSLVGLVVVKPNIIASVRFKKLPKQVPAAGQLFELSSTIHDLVPKCTAEWSNVQAEGYENFNGKLLPDGFGSIQVKDVDENFLSEIIDYGNDTINVNIKLTVPAKNETNNWPGLKGDSKYKFRLTIVCPEPLNDAENMTKRGTVTSSTEIEIHTNSAPQGLPLLIVPPNGTAVQTIFKFATGIAKDKDTDYPLKYSFFYQLDNYTINLNENYENTVVETDLPYAVKPLKTFYRICDSRDACAVVAGPDVQTTLNEAVISKDIQLRMETIETHFKRFEFQTGFSKSFTFILTISHFSNQTVYMDVKKWMIELINSEIESIKNNQETQTYYIPALQIIYFVQQTQRIITLLKPENDYEMTQELLKLFDAAIGNRNTLNARPKRNLDDPSLRSIPIDSNHIMVVLELTENLLQSSNNATVIKMQQMKLIERIHQYLMQWCALEESTTEVLDTKIVSFDFEKLAPREALNKMRNFVIPRSSFTNSLQFRISNLYEVTGGKEYCLGKIYYPKNMLGDVVTRDNSPIYEFFVVEYDKTTEKSKYLEPSQEDTDAYVAIRFPENMSYNSYKCAIWMNYSWKTDLCVEVPTNTNKNIKECHCSTMGFFRFQNLDIGRPMFTTGNSIEITNVTTKEISTATSITISRISNEQQTPSTALPVSHPITTSSSLGVEEQITTSTQVKSPTSTASTVRYHTTTQMAFKPMPSQSFQPHTNEGAIITANPTQPTKQTANKTNAPPVSTGIAIIATGKPKSNTAFIFGYSLLAFIILSAGVGLIVYRIRKKSNNLSVERLITELEDREPAAGIKYARFYDESIMNGMDVSFN